MSIIKSAITAHQAGDLSKASALYHQQLKLRPSDPNANQLLGLLYFSSGNYDDARKYMEKSLAVTPNQPHVWNNLGTCLNKIGQQHQSVICYQKAISIQADYIEAFKNLIASQRAVGEYANALISVKQALSVRPDDISLLVQQGKIYKDLADHSNQIKIYNKVLAKQPNNVEVRFDLGLALRQADQPEQALKHYLLLENQGLDNYQLAHNIANAYSDLGKLELAISYYERALAHNPNYIESHKNLNDLLWETNNRDRYLNSYRQALTQAQKSPDIHFAYANSLIRVSMFRQAEHFLSQLADPLNTFPEYYDLLGQALIGLQKKSEAMAVQQQGSTYADASTSQLIAYARSLIETDNIDLAIIQLERVLTINPHEQMAIAYLGVCWRLKSDPKEQLLNNYQGLVREYDIAPPADFESTGQYCDALNCFLDKLHTSENQPLEQTLYKGTQSRGNILSNQHPLIQYLNQQIKVCVTDYIEKTKDLNNSLTAQGLLSERIITEQIDFSGSWSVRLSKQGFHTTHVHPMGWLSSVFYVELPEVIERNEEHQGWLEFGSPNLSLPFKLEAARHIKPQIGKLVLFPSYMWHGTIPFQTDEKRTTIALDIVPKT